ncbi:transcriptional regulator with XRE-family HTH domain [Streptacidiphilus sp. MAP12-20]|uniref:hypothetical protein n=1 Tax=Streptacidiphilus sp. MAP12-20 TaxID=3156299 RepID=UPI0035159732
MAGTAEQGERQPRTLAEKLQWLRVLKTPEGGKPPSYAKMAAQISEETGVSISHAYIWELAKGKTTNPSLEHLEAIAAWFKIPLVYLTGGPGFEQLETDLELLHHLKSAGVKDIKVQDVAGGSADADAVQALVGRLQLLEAFGDAAVQEAAVQLGGLPEQQRQAVGKVLKDSTLLDALQTEEVRQLVHSANSLSPDRLDAAQAAVEDVALLDALSESGVREIARKAAGLSPASQHAVVTMIEQLRNVEQTGSN